MAKVIVIGAGVGGLAAATRLAQHGLAVQVLEARSRPGGLAETQFHDGVRFDAGPYVLLDRPGLEWAFEQLGLGLEDHLQLTRIDAVYEVQSAGAQPPIRFWDSLDQTADALEMLASQCGQQYRRFVASTAATYRRLQPLQRVSHPGLRDVLRTGGWRDLPFLLRSLGTVLARSRLPQAVQEAAGIWTHVAGQSMQKAPSPLALVPAVIHEFGAWYPRGGVGTIPRALAQAATNLGVEFRYETPVRTIHCQRGRVTGVETTEGEFLAADAVLANAAGVGTYLELLDERTRHDHLPQRVRRALNELPLQSPGICVYLTTRRPPQPPYLRFYLPGGDDVCRLLVQADVVDAETDPSIRHDSAHSAGAAGKECAARRDAGAGSELYRARLIVPMRHDQAVAGGAAAQQEFLARILEEPWWKEHVGEARVLATQTPTQWSREFHLYRESMNPVMTARFMRSGRLAHRCPHVRGLYLAGSATHPGQWVSFCAISGVLSADLIREDAA